MSTAVPPVAAHPPDPQGRHFLSDLARLLGVGHEAVHKFRGISLAEGGAGPRGLPHPDGYETGRGSRLRPWWYPETLIRWAIAVGLRHPYTGQPQRLAQSNTPHPPRPTVKAPDRRFFRRLVNDSTHWYLNDVADESGYPVATVKRKFRHVCLAEGGMGPHGMPLPDGYDPPWPGNPLPRPWWWAGTVCRWLITTGRMDTYPDSSRSGHDRPDRNRRPPRRSGAEPENRDARTAE